MGEETNKTWKTERRERATNDATKFCCFTLEIARSCESIYSHRES